MEHTHITLISGPPATGKTIFAHALKERLYKEGHRVLVIDELAPVILKERYDSNKWDHIIVTTNKVVNVRDLPCRITTTVRTARG